MIPQLLLYKILQLFVIMVLGFVLVKAKIIKSGDSVLLSKLTLYLFMPAIILNSFNVDVTGEIMEGLGIAFAVSIMIHILLLGTDFIFKKTIKATGTERASIMYSNAGNLVIPIVSFVLGDEWVIYSCAFLVVEIVFMWTHGICLFLQDKKINIKKILLNVNMIAVFVGFIIMFSGFRFPAFVSDITTSLSGMIAPAGMLIAGMLAADIDFKKMLKNKRLYFVCFARLIICPLVVLALLKIVMMFVSIENEYEIMLIPYLASITPTATTILQFSQIYGNDSDYSVVINALTTVGCIATMPLLVAVF